MYSAGSPDNRPLGSSAVYSCNPGYTLTGGTFTVGTTRTCVSGGMWDGSSPTCQGEFCNCYTVCVCGYTHVNPIKKMCESNLWLRGKRSYVEDIIPGTQDPLSPVLT